MVQSSHKRLKWSRDSQLDGVHVPAQFHWVQEYIWNLIFSTILLQLGLDTGISSYLMQLQAARQLFFQGIQMKYGLLSSHQMGGHLYLEVMIRLSSSGICRQVELLKLSLATLSWFTLFPFQWTAPQLLQDHTTYVWDITGSHPCLVETVTQECDSITSITFSSSSLITASNDRLIKFWQIGIPPTDSVATNTLSTPLTSAAIESTTLQAKDSIAISSDSAGVVRVWDLSTGLCKAFFQTLAKGNTNRDAQMIEGRLIFVWHRKGEGEIHIWDIEKGEPLQTVEAHSEVKDLRISGDGSKVFCLNGKLIQAWSLWTGEAVGEVKVGYLTHLPSVHAYTGGSRICVHSHYSSTQEWDFGISGSSPVQLSNTSSEKLCQHLVWTSWSDDSSVIEDTVTGEIVFQLFGRHEETYIAQWDGQYLVAGYRSGEVLILDRSHLCV
jgi:WD40 repeat protein